MVGGSGPVPEVLRFPAPQSGRRPVSRRRRGRRPDCCAPIRPSLAEKSQFAVMARREAASIARSTSGALQRSRIASSEAAPPSRRQVQARASQRPSSTRVAPSGVSRTPASVSKIATSTGGALLPPDRLAPFAQREPRVAAPVPAAPHLFDHEVDRVGEAVGEAAGDRARAAHDEARDSRHRDAGPEVAVGQLADDLVPDGGEAVHLEVRVARVERGARGREAPGNGDVVARAEAGERREPRDERRDVAHGPDRRRGARRRGRRGGGGRAGTSFAASTPGAERLEDHDLRVSLRLREADEAHEPKRQERVRGPPRLVRNAEEAQLPRTAALEARVHSRGVGLGQLARPAVERGGLLLGAGREEVLPHEEVDDQGGGRVVEQLAEPPLADDLHEEHLERPVVRVGVAVRRGEGEVVRRGGVHHAVRVAAEGEVAAAGREAAGGIPDTRSHDQTFYERVVGGLSETLPGPVRTS